MSLSNAPEASRLGVRLDIVSDHANPPKFGHRRLVIHSYRRGRLRINLNTADLLRRSSSPKALAWVAPLGKIKKI